MPNKIGINTLMAYPNLFLKEFTASMISSYTLKITAIAAPLTPGIAAPTPMPIPANNLFKNFIRVKYNNIYMLIKENYFIKVYNTSRVL